MEEEVERNILQLHGVEKHEIATDDIKFDNDEELASVADDIESSENFENEPVEVEKEIEILIQNDKGVDEETLFKTENETDPIEEEDSLIDVDNVADDVLDTVITLSESESLESASEETEEELCESELHYDDDADNNFEVVTDIEEDIATMVSEGDDDSIVENEDEEVDEEDFPRDNIGVFSEQDEFSDEEDFVDLDGHDDETIDSLLSEEMENTNLENDIESMPECLPTRSRERPNFMFRFLLDYGLIGHILIMELILVAEWFQAYVPMLPSLLKYVVYDVLKYKKESRRDNGDRAYDQPSGLINPDGTSRVGKKPKQQTKKDDQKALDNLRNIGDVFKQNIGLSLRRLWSGIP
mmetsp:Transcript_47506/g.53780  ORF Transcript_47506/g.53780 Transcript_47506/m.53780 type:complete len:355 (-) Transcript_47506:1156-2220(-)